LQTAVILQFKRLICAYQYRQDDPAVSEFIATSNIVLKPKLEWAKLETAMEKTS
jgi:hypothetical protein